MLERRDEAPLGRLNVHTLSRVMAKASLRGYARCALLSWYRRAPCRLCFFFNGPKDDVYTSTLMVAT